MQARAPSVVVVSALLALASCADSGSTVATFDVTTPAFAEGDTIPERHTCDGDGLSVPLLVSGGPKEAASLAVIAEDPDAPGGTVLHWLLWNVPPDMALIPEGLARTGNPRDGLTQGTAADDGLGYFPPCPPEGEEHRYFFRVYALDAKLDLKAGADRDALGSAMKSHIVGKGSVMGRYKRLE
ncbi:MAG: YbhB/YbcL family Raf kinase inhibitor-like protein [Deltaproteobacteria bacterium]|nr:YbhB/YbcL family Raf kinase inhibitor-like protein [Deltaproteobacteria bacterium]